MKANNFLEQTGVSLYGQGDRCEELKQELERCNHEGKKRWKISDRSPRYIFRFITSLWNAVKLALLKLTRRFV